MTPLMKRCICMASIAVCDVALVVPMLPQVRARIVYNASASVALGWCCITLDFGPGSLRVGSTVLARLLDSVAAFAALCSHLPWGFGASNASTLWLWLGQIVRIHGQAVATARCTTGMCALWVWAPCRRLAERELFLLCEENPASLHSRHFGSVDASAEIGIAEPL